MSIDYDDYMSKQIPVSPGNIDSQNAGQYGLAKSLSYSQIEEMDKANMQKQNTILQAAMDKVNSWNPPVVNNVNNPVGFGQHARTVHKVTGQACLPSTG